MVKNKKDIDFPDIALDALKNCDKDIFLLIYSRLKILSSFLLSVALAKRSFSPLKKIKSWLQTNKTEERLSLDYFSFADINLCEDQVIAMFTKENRKKDC